MGVSNQFQVSDVLYPIEGYTNIQWIGVDESQGRSGRGDEEKCPTLPRRMAASLTELHQCPFVLCSSIEIIQLGGW
jgi:hypothetical protein